MSCEVAQLGGCKCSLYEELYHYHFYNLVSMLSSWAPCAQSSFIHLYHQFIQWLNTSVFMNFTCLAARETLAYLKGKLRSCVKPIYMV